jgi:hypothetical protein
MTQQLLRNIPLSGRLRSLCALIGVISASAGAVPLSIDGLVAPDVAQLQGLGAISKTVGADTYVGVSLWSLLAGTGGNGITTTGGGNNAILRNYVLAAGDTGGSELISVGEIHPNFGGQGDPFLVAYQLNGVALGAPVLIDAEDPTRTRDLPNLASLRVLSAPRPPAGAGGVSTSFDLTGVGAPAKYNLAALQALPATTATNVTFLRGSTPVGPHDYAGVRLWDLLNLGGIDASSISTGYLIATGSDGYEVLFSLAELDPTLGGIPALIAYAVDGSNLGADGFTRVVVPGDSRGGRYVSNIVSLDVRSVPEPASALLLSTGVWCVARWARRPEWRWRRIGTGTNRH